MMSGLSGYARRRAARLLVDERGQDLVEYALLTGIIAVVSLMIGPPLVDRLKTAYETRNTAIHGIAAPLEP
jgi:Flp pilus assembly pilin Flp